MSNKARSRKQKQFVKDFQNQLVDDIKQMFNIPCSGSVTINGKTKTYNFKAIK